MQKNNPTFGLPQKATDMARQGASEKNSPPFGLPQKVIDNITAILAKHAPVTQAIIYGSRAMGNYRKGSDIDLTLHGTNLTAQLCHTIANELDDLPMLYSIDLSVYDLLNHAKLKDHIDRRGKVFYDRFAGWKVLPFEECLVKIKTPRKLPKKYYLKCGDFPIVSQESALINGYHNDKKNIFKVEKPIIIFGDHTQVIKFIDFNFVMGADGAKILLPINDIDSKFFYYTLIAMMPKSIGYARHYSLLKKLQISYPPLAEQKRIVKKLDSAFAEIDKSIELINKKTTEIDKLKSALLTTALSVKNTTPKTTKPKNKQWDLAKLGSVATVIAGQSPKGENYNKNGVGTPFMQGKKDYGKKFTNPPTVWTTKTTRIAEEGDILMSVRAPVGAINIANQQICIGRGLAAIRASKQTTRDYLFYTLLQISDKLVGSAGAVFDSINKQQIENIKIPFPPLAEQKSIVAKLDSAFTNLQIAKTAMEKSKQNYQSLKTALLTQELKPTDA